MSNHRLVGYHGIPRQYRSMLPGTMIPMKMVFACIMVAAAAAAAADGDQGFRETTLAYGGFPADSTSDQPFICDYRALAWEFAKKVGAPPHIALSACIASLRRLVQRRVVIIGAIAVAETFVISQRPAGLGRGHTNTAHMC